MLLRITLLSMCCVSVGMSQESSHPLLGKWRSVETSKGGIGAIVDFHSNGTFDYSPGAVIGGRYRVENNRLVTTYDNGDPETTMTIESVTDTVLRLSVDKGGSLHYKRVGPTENPSNPLLGTWITVAPMQGMPNKSYGYHYFRRDGRETFVVPFLTSHCTYSIAGDRIRLTMPGRGSKEGALRWEGDVLVLPWGHGEGKFKRF